MLFKRLLIAVITVFLTTCPISAEEQSNASPADFSSIRRGLADGAFVPIAFQRPNTLLGEKNGVFTVGNVRWDVLPQSKQPWYAVPHRFVTATIDPGKAGRVFFGRQTVSPLFLHAFMVITFSEGGLSVNGQSSQGLVLTIEPLLRQDQHQWTTPIAMFKGRYPKHLQLATWENFAVFTGEIMKQMAWLRPMRSADPLAARKMAESFVRHATAPSATAPFDWATNNCAASLFPIVIDGLARSERQKLTEVLGTSSKPNFSRWFEKHLRAAGIMDETKGLRLYKKNFFIPLKDLLREAGLL